MRLKLNLMPRVVVLSGAGMSAESGLSTFRGAGGLWEGHDIMEVASPVGWRKDPELVLSFYNQRRRQLLQVQPNAAHYRLAEFERKSDIEVNIITQNVDNLHERAGSSNVLHLHGELLKVRSTTNEDLVYDWKKDIHMGDLCESGSQLRPHVVWFGEAVPMIPKAAEIVQKADAMIVVGTSLQVYPAASLIEFLQARKSLYYIDPQPSDKVRGIPQSQVHTFATSATEGIPIVLKALSKQF